MKLVKYMNNSRNFTNDISNKNSFISLRNEINKKIKETLFDENLLFISSSFNSFCTTYDSLELVDEAKNISNLIDNLNASNEEEKNENNSIGSSTPPCEHGTEIGMNDMSDSKKKSSESEDEKSSSFGSKLSKLSQADENKKKLCISFMQYPELIQLLNIKNIKKGENENDININININDTEKVKQRILELENDIENNKDIKIKNRYLRKMVCLKLYKALHFALKNLELDESQIKIICLYIEIQGRILDTSMSVKYKEFIENILKKISVDKIISN